MKLERRIRIIREYGWKLFAADFLSSNIRIPKITTRWKDRVFIELLKKKYDFVINRHINEKPKRGSAPFIWSMWWQGTDNLPEVVSLCFEAINRHRASRPFIVITKDNYKDYVRLPDYITEKVKNGTIRLTHFSDIVRMYLLSRYGGMWIDATVLVTRDIPEEFFGMSYCTLRRPTNQSEYNVSLRRWCICVQSAWPGCPLCEFVLDMWLEYWRTQNFLADYVLTDYFFALAYETLPECRKLIEAVPFGNYAFDDLQHVLASEWDAEKFDAMNRGTQFFKMTYKHKFPRTTRHGHETLYGHLVTKKGN